MDLKNKKILILSPHTDDAELGAGATVSKLVGDNEVLWLVFSTASKSLPATLSPDTLLKEFQNVIYSLNLKDSNYKIFDHEVRKLNDVRQEILEELVSVKNDFLPDLVIGPSINDLHQDHIVVANEMIRAFKLTSSIISYELPWNHITFNTQMFVRLNSQDIENKIKLLSNYKSQFEKNRHYFSEDFIKGLALTRGSQINHKYAEAFEVIRWIV